MNIFSVKDQAEGQLFADILASDLSITLNSGEGAKFPQPIIGDATSSGDKSTLNSTGIQAKGVAVGDFIENVTDNSLAVIISISTDSIVTTDLRGGSGNLWESSDEWAINRMVGTLQSRSVNASGVVTITKEEKILIENRNSDVFTIKSRGFDGSSATGFSTDDYLVLNVVALQHSSVISVVSDALLLIQNKADTSLVNSLLNARIWKNPSCKASSFGLGNITLSGTQTIDDIPLSVDDEAVITDQTNQVENGIYIVKSSTWERRSDFDTGEDVAGAAIRVVEGTENGDKTFNVTGEPAIVGTNNIVIDVSPVLVKATTAKAIAGIDDLDYMTPKTTKESIEANEAYPKVIYSSASQTFTANAIYSFTHSLGLTQTDVQEGRYTIYITINEGGGNESSYVAGFNNFGTTAWGGSGIGLGVVRSRWVATDPGNTKDANFQTNDVKVKWGAATLPFGRLHIVKMF